MSVADAPVIARPDTRRRYDLVVPTTGSPALHELLRSLAHAEGPPPDRIFVVDDRKADGYHFVPLDLSGLPPGFASRISVVRSHGMGPAFARNVGWSASLAPWIAFLSDDVVVDVRWPAAVARDLDEIERLSDAERVAASFGAGAGASCAERARTTDALVRRSALEGVEGFDPRFPHAHREETDLIIRFERAGLRVVPSARVSARSDDRTSPWSIVAKHDRLQDEAVMAAIHGGAWRAEPGGERGRHASIVAAALDGASAALEGRPRAAVGYALAWLFGTTLLAARRFERGARTPRNGAVAFAISLAVPFAAVYHRLRGERLAAGLVRPRVRAVLFERDGTLFEGASGDDPRRIAARPGAASALERLREAHVRVGIVASEPGPRHGTILPSSQDRTRDRAGELVGPVDVWADCAHAESAGCTCRLPAPDLIVRAARDLDVPVDRCAVVGGLEAVAAAKAAGAFGLLVPGPRTSPGDVAQARYVVPSLARAVDLVLGGRL